MTLDELDKLSAEKIMGFTVDQYYYELTDHFEWQPTHNISQAWECLQKLGYEYSLYSTNGRHGCVVWPFGANYDYVSEADSAAEAIVCACLRAKGITI